MYGPHLIGSCEHSIFPALQNKQVYQTLVPGVIAKSAQLEDQFEIKTGLTEIHVHCDPNINTTLLEFLYAVQE